MGAAASQNLDGFVAVDSEVVAIVVAVVVAAAAGVVVLVAAETAVVDAAVVAVVAVAAAVVAFESSELALQKLWKLWAFDVARDGELAPTWVCVSEPPTWLGTLRCLEGLVKRMATEQVLLLHWRVFFQLLLGRQVQEQLLADPLSHLAFAGQAELVLVEWL